MYGSRVDRLAAQLAVLSALEGAGSQRTAELACANQSFHVPWHVQVGGQPLLARDFPILLGPRALRKGPACREGPHFDPVAQERATQASRTAFRLAGQTSPRHHGWPGHRRSSPHRKAIPMRPLELLF